MEPKENALNNKSNDQEINNEKLNDFIEDMKADPAYQTPEK